MMVRPQKGCICNVHDLLSTEGKSYSTRERAYGNCLGTSEGVTPNHLSTSEEGA